MISALCGRGPAIHCFLRGPIFMKYEGLNKNNAGFSSKAKTMNIVRKSSILHSVLEMEEELIKRENEALKHAEEIITEAKKAGDTIVEETTKELPILENDKKKKLLESVDATIKELKLTEEQDKIRLKEMITRNRNKAIDFIVGKVIPG